MISNALRWPESFRAWRREQGTERVVAKLIGVKQKQISYLSWGFMLLHDDVKETLLSLGFPEKQLPPKDFRTHARGRGDRSTYNKGAMQTPPGHEKRILDKESVAIQEDFHSRRIRRWFRSKRGGHYDPEDANQLTEMVMRHRIFKFALANPEQFLKDIA